MSRVHNKGGRCGGSPRIDDSHVPFGLDGCLDLDLDLVRFQAFAQVGIFSSFVKAWPLMMIYNMVGVKGPNMKSLQEFFRFILFHFLAFDFFPAVVWLANSSFGVNTRSGAIIPYTLRVAIILANLESSLASAKSSLRIDISKLNSSFGMDLIDPWS